MNIPIKLISDAKGYFDRECPNENCLYTFKINMQDWEEKVFDETVYCPMCGHVDTSDKWWTKEQLEAMQKIAADYAMEMITGKLDKAFGKLARSTRNNKFVKITYKPGKRISFVNNPIGQREEWEQDIQCPYCFTRYSVIGTAHFCPCCGKTIIDSTFDSSIDNTVKMIESIDEMEDLFAKLYGIDKAKSMCTDMLEGTFGDIVSAFQLFAATIYTQISSKNVRKNDFQIIEKGSKLFFEASGKSYDDFIDASEIEKLNVAFQKRHVFEHGGGIVDEDYLRKSRDTSYKLGQRLIIHKSEVLETIEIVKKLSAGLKSIK